MAQSQTRLLTVTTADAELSETLPANTIRVLVRNLSNRQLRFSFALGKVAAVSTTATPGNLPYLIAGPAGTPEAESDSGQVSISSGTFYYASSQLGHQFELVLFLA